ncbi:P-loop containing nucleoside triphosphate hydrolases superfamily protein [Actinidia rufa]|uniref:P-loop containing nucleoside triphosphate hydrolases superfamily protein n=1 Tax=Actinidia rufa TaxID=165716 RepID=A0A7J0FGN3_9ERIC|nr:P-loop containing nucleoside triphosphate hydrolases superfamily protein [Actinidia rufa]
MSASRALYISHIEALQNVVRLHNASSNAGLEEISASVSSNADSIEKFLAAEAIEANSIFDDLQGALSTHQGEMAHFARELRQRFNDSIEHSKNISEFTHGFLHKLIEESRELQSHAIQVDEIQTTSILEFQKAYEKQSQSDADRLIADVTDLVSNHIRRQKELVDARLICLKETVTGNKTFLDGHVSSMEVKHVSTLVTLVRNVSDGNEQHDTEIGMARSTTEDDVAKSSDDVIQHVNSVSKQECGSISDILASVKAHTNTLEVLREDHSVQSSSIKQKAVHAFRQQYMDYEPTGTTPIRCEPDIPSKGTIESLRAMPIEALLEEYRENHSFVLPEVKQPQPSLIPRSPLTQLNS